MFLVRRPKCKEELRNRSVECRFRGNLSAEILGRSDGIALSRWQPQGGPSVLLGSVPRASERRGYAPQWAEWEVATSSWEGRLPRLLIWEPAPFSCTALHTCWLHPGIKEPACRWPERTMLDEVGPCAHNPSKTFRTQEVPSVHNQPSWSSAHKPKRISNPLNANVWLSYNPILAFNMIWTDSKEKALFLVEFEVVFYYEVL